MTSVYEFDDYRKYLQKRLSDLPNHGYGQLSRIARKICVHPTLLSQILKGHKELTTDQAASLVEYFGMGENESEYFVLLVHRQRAGTAAARKIYSKRLLRLKEKSQKISNRIKVTASLSEEIRAVFYSDWVYSAVRQTIAMLPKADIQVIAEHLGVSLKRARAAMDFLLKAGLCRIVSGQFQIVASSTHVEPESPWVKVHHTNWRQKSIQNMEKQNDADVHYTAPMTLSKKDVELIRERLLQLIEEVNSVVRASDSEELWCLNMDWFSVKR